MANRPLLKDAPATTSVAVHKPSSMVSIADQIAAQAAAISERITAPSGNKIKLSPGAFSLPDGTKTPGPLELVIVDFVVKNSFYAGNFDANNIQPPVCFAIGTNPAKMVPSANSPEPQAKTCAECPMNQFGSAGNGKACKNERLLAVLPPDADSTTGMMTLNVSPTGLKGFDGYVGSVSRSFSTPPVGVITAVSLDPNKTYASLMFGDPVPNPDMHDHFARQAEAQALLATEPDVSGAKPAKKPAARSLVRR